MSETTEEGKASAARLAGLRNAIREEPALPEGWSPHGTGYRREDGWIVRPYGEGRWCTVTPGAALYGGDMPRTSAAAIARVPPMKLKAEPEDACEDACEDVVVDDDNEGVESKVLLATSQYNERAGREVWSPVPAVEIAEEVSDGWRVEVVQWSDEPGEALCVVLRRER